MGLLSSIASISNGFTTGHLMHQSKKSEDTITQGQNYVLAAGQQLIQTNLAFSQLAEVTGTISNLFPLGIIGAPFLLATSFPARLTMTVTVVFAALYRNDQFKNFAAAYNGFLENYQPGLTPYLSLNPEVSELKGRIFVFISTHSSNISQVVVTICAVAKYALGAEKEAIATLMIMGVGFLDRRGLLPERVSIFFNDNLTNVANISAVILGSPLQKLIGAVNFSLSSGYLMKKISYAIDNKVQAFFGRYGIFYPTLESLEKKPSTSTQAKMTAAEILAFDANRPSRIDTSHVQRGISVPSAPHAKFETLNVLFDKIGFNGAALTRLVNKIQHDDRFIKEFLINSEETKKLLSDNLTSIGQMRWQEALVSGEELNSAILDPIYKEINAQGKAIWEKHLFEYGKVQLGLFIENISGKKQPKGDLSGIIKTRETCKTVIAFMEDQYKIVEDANSSPDEMRISTLNIQSLLTKLLVEGGDYCVQGIEGAVRDCMDRVLEERGGDGTIQGRLDLMAQNARNHLFGQMYGLVTDKNFNAAFEFIQANDRHTFNQLKIVYGTGLGLDLSDAQNDKAVPISKLESLLLPTIYPISRIPFWNTDLTFNELNFKLNQVETENIAKATQIKQIYNDSTKSDWKIIRTVQKTIELAPRLFKLVGSTYLIVAFESILQFNQKTDFAYNETMLIERAKEMIGTTVAINDYSTWWQNYIKTLSNGDGDLEEQLFKEILYTPDSGFMQFDNSGKQVANPKYIKIMLIEMGFLKKSK